MDKPWKPFELVCNDVNDPFRVHDELALMVDLIIFKIIEGRL